jgi:hypothetical protein
MHQGAGLQERLLNVPYPSALSATLRLPSAEEHLDVSFEALRCWRKVLMNRMSRPRKDAI